MEQYKYDAVIVGAGPAGSTTAKYAARAGAKVVILEKRAEIGLPVRCGEGIGKETLAKAGLRPEPNWIANEVKGARIFAPNGQKIVLSDKFAGNECGYVIHRDRFDQALAIAAIESGAELMIRTAAVGLLFDADHSKVRGVKAVRMGERIDIEANIVVGADGFESQVGRWGGINTTLKPSDIATCFEYYLVGIDCDPDYTDFYIGSFAPGGYVWVFPKSAHEANVGIGVQLSKILQQRENSGMPKQLLDKFIRRKPTLAKGKPLRQIAGAISCCMPLEQTVKDGLIIVGDAARQIDPLTGGGIGNACIAGKIAGEIIGKAVARADFSLNSLIEYDKGWRRELEAQLIRNWLAKEKLSSLNDDVINKIIDAVQSVKLETLSTLSLLKAVQTKYPELAREFESLL
jgi:digeranylgeranylglycerophospholipid reductase